MIERRSAIHALFTQAANLFTKNTSNVTLQERRPIAVLQISAFAQSIKETESRLSTALNITLPQPNHYTENQMMSLRHHGHGIWQIVGTPDTMMQAQALRTTLDGVATVVDLSHARTSFVVCGPAAAKTISKFCGLDLDARQFPTGNSTQTRFGHIGMTLTRYDDSPAYELMVFRGYAQHVGESLIEGAAEFGLRVIVD